MFSRLMPNWIVRFYIATVERQRGGWALFFGLIVTPILIVLHHFVALCWRRPWVVPIFAVVFWWLDVNHRRAVTSLDNQIATQMQVLSVSRIHLHPDTYHPVITVKVRNASSRDLMCSGWDAAQQTVLWPIMAAFTSVIASISSWSKASPTGITCIAMTRRPAATRLLLFGADDPTEFTPNPTFAYPDEDATFSDCVLASSVDQAKARIIDLVGPDVANGKMIYAKQDRSASQTIRRVP